MYQRKVDVDMLNVVKSTYSLRHTLRRSAYPYQPYVDTLHVLPPRRRRPKLVLTGTSIPLHFDYRLNTLFAYSCCVIRVLCSVDLISTIF